MGDIRMRQRLGIDFQSVHDVAGSLRLFGSDYLESIYNDRERDYALSHPHCAARYLAGRFAGREAVLKLLNSLDSFAMWGDIILGDDYGSTTVRLRGNALLLATEWGLDDIRLCIASTKELAAAVAVADLRIRPDAKGLGQT